jgi:hypothetical protein
MKTTALAMVPLAVLAFVGASLGQARPAAGPAGDPYEYYRLGETVGSLQDIAYYFLVRERLKARLDEHGALMRKLKLGAQTHAAYDAVSSLALALPFQREPDYSKWSPEDQKRWTDGRALRTKLSASLEADLAKNPHGEFYYWLGRASLELGFTVPQDLRVGVRFYEENQKRLVATFTWLRDNPAAKNLTPDVAARVNSIADLKTKVDDPLAGLTKKDVDAMIESAQSIRDAARENMLVR